ncbi:hypothetical protein ABI_24490 [Asticcacaulis biprosthecium C19]|uniref:Uncharacterized protein n=1 Tax=Asticcacaulis biprosthecium C19 TaxID=715226 RepID=F4QNX8_9CAUL|nr:hypothetical protein ABI_24490 [Asticcacaulis biprosthecium C19]
MALRLKQMAQAVANKTVVIDHMNEGNGLRWVAGKRLGFMGQQAIVSGRL